MNSAELPKPEVNMSRRHFLRAALAVGGGVALSSIILNSVAEALPLQEEDPAHPSMKSTPAGETPPTPVPPSTTTSVQVRERAPAQEDTDEPENPPFWQFPAWYEQLGSPDQSYIQSIGQAFLMDAITVPSTIILSKFGVPVGNAAMMELLTDPKKLVLLPPAGRLFADAAIAAPIVEELKYRALPSAVLNFFMRDQPNYKTTSAALPVAIGTSAWFAHAHNKGADEPTIPMPQFVGGMLFWRQTRNSGVTHSMAAHAATNAVLMGLGLPGIESRRKAALEDQQVEIEARVHQSIYRRPDGRY